MWPKFHAPLSGSNVKLILWACECCRVTGPTNGEQQDQPMESNKLWGHRWGFVRILQQLMLFPTLLQHLQIRYTASQALNFKDEN